MNDLEIQAAYKALAKHKTNRKLVVRQSSENRGNRHCANSFAINVGLGGVDDVSWDKD